MHPSHLHALPRPPRLQCTSIARPGGSNVFVRVGAYNPLTDEALREVRLAAPLAAWW